MFTIHYKNFVLLKYYKRTQYMKLHIGNHYVKCVSFVLLVRGDLIFTTKRKPQEIGK